MRVYNWDQFLALPEGVFFMKGSRLCFEDLCMKGATIGDDFLYVSMVMIEAKSSEEFYERLEKMEKGDASFPLDPDISRDGTFDRSAVFLVYELEDLELFQKYLTAGIKMLKSRRGSEQVI